MKNKVTKENNSTKILLIFGGLSLVVISIVSLAAVFYVINLRNNQDNTSVINEDDISILQTGAIYTDKASSDFIYNSPDLKFSEQLDLTKEIYRKF